MKRLILTCTSIVLCIVIFAAPATAAATAAPSVSAQGAVLMEAASGEVLIDHNGDTRLPMASTTKIMTALVAIEHTKKLDREVKVSEEAAGIEGSSIYLSAGEKLTMEQLLYALMLESANDAAAAIACEVAGSVEDFAALMNEKAEELGLTNTHFTNPHGLDDEEHYTSAKDLATLACAALQNETFQKIVSTYKQKIPLNGSEGTRVLVNHNRLLQSYEGAIGVKTGFTKRSGRCLVSAAQRDGVTLVAVTLNDPDDWKDHKAMLDYGFSTYQNYVLAEEGALTFSLPCTGGQKDYITATNRDALSLSLPKSGGPITTVLESDPFLYAPVKKGDLVGYAVFLRDGKEIGRVALYADMACPTIELQKGIFHFFK
ncbi:MAG: D-alanyl-D-alanine carboxypeptidase [Clostridiales bacterium]|nr:D-alanyl-D-alanine carboxypeptidase [Clostridiales bacterium]